MRLATVSFYESVSPLFPIIAVMPFNFLLENLRRYGTVPIFATISALLDWPRFFDTGD
jgi:hypothetical protein